MGFKIKRGMVLRTTRALKVKGQSIATGTRVKAMAEVDKSTLKVKVKDSNYPKLTGEHAVVSYEAVTKVDRGRPQGEETVSASAKKTTRKPAAAKKTTRKPAARKPAARKSAAPASATAPATPAPEPTATEE